MIDEARIIEIKEDILSDNNTAAEAHRQQLAQQGTLFVDVMSSPGAGKTTLLLSLIERMRGKANIGIIEADIESFVDSEKIKQAGIPAVQLETRGICHVEMDMVAKAFAAFGQADFDYVFLENIGIWFVLRNSTRVRISASCCFQCPRASTRCTSTRPCSR